MKRSNRNGLWTVLFLALVALLVGACVFSTNGTGTGGTGGGTGGSGGSAMVTGSGGEAGSGGRTTSSTTSVSSSSSTSSSTTSASTSSSSSSTSSSTTSASGTGGSGGSGGADAGPPMGPCGVIDMNADWSVCAYNLPPPASGGNVGLAGGVTKQGSPTIDLVWQDNYCTNADPTADWVYCTANIQSGFYWQFSPSAHNGQFGGTILGGWYCDANACQGDVVVYHKGVIFGEMHSNVYTGGLLHLAHYQAPAHIDFKVIAP